MHAYRPILLNWWSKIEFNLNYLRHHVCSMKFVLNTNQLKYFTFHVSMKKQIDSEWRSVSLWFVMSANDYIQALAQNMEEKQRGWKPKTESEDPGQEDVNGGNIEEGVPERQNVFKWSYCVSLKVVFYGKSSAHLMTGIKATYFLSHHRNLVTKIWFVCRNHSSFSPRGGVFT